MNSLKKSLFALAVLMLLLAGQDMTSQSTVQAQSVPSFLVWSDDSHRLAVSIEAGALVIEGGRIISRCAVDGTVSALTFSPDSETLYVGTNEGGLMICNARTGRKPGLQQQIIPRPTRIAGFIVNPANDGRFFVMSGSQAPDGFYLYDASLTYLDQYNPLGFDLPSPLFLPDGRLLTFSREGDVITAAYEGQPGAQMTLPGPTQYVRVSSDGHYMLASTMDSDMLVFNVETGVLESNFGEANFVMSINGEVVLLSGLNGPIAVSLRTGQVLGTWTWTQDEESLLYVENEPAVLLRQRSTDQPRLFRMDTGEMLPLNVGQKAYARIDFGLDDSLLLFGVTETGTDIITYPLSGPKVPVLHPFTQVLSERVHTTRGHAFGFFDYQTLMVFDVNTGKVLHEHAIPSFNFDRFKERPDGNAYVVREDQILTIRTLDGEETVITLPN